jgi:hypothetical protein
MSSRAQKIRGICLRGNVFWFTRRTGKHRLQVSLETGSGAEAVEKARTILENPVLNLGNGFLKEERSTRRTCARFAGADSAPSLP